MQVLLFGMIAEKAGADRIQVDASSLDQLRTRLVERVEGLATMSYAIAVDRRVVQQDMPFTGTEEIAVLPPFAGG
ncbi:MAG: MoaD/ThiS family protein [Flavobacteriales bacterium]|nr:MoaD/ThiS family protein [Flavobacteriales bacterium]